MAAPSRTVVRLAAVTFLVNVFVVVWGAWVRASGSGAGCGNHWPTCNGQIIPQTPGMHTLVEFIHRAGSGLAFVLVVALLYAAWRAFPRGTPTRRAAIASFILLCIEAAIGAALVKFNLVTTNASVTRALALGVHLINTQLLLSAMALTGWWANGAPSLDFRAIGPRVWWFGAAFAALIVVGFLGVFASLGDTLFPSTTLANGFAADRSATSGILIHVRIWHPIAALAAGAGMLLLANASTRWRPTPDVLTAARGAVALVLLQWGAGALSLALLAPVPLQLIHLLLADLVWLGCVWLGVTTLAAQAGPTVLSTRRALSASKTVPAP